MLIEKALEAGITFVDTANVCSAGSSEEITGRAVRDFADRDDVVLATKVHGRMRPGPNGAGLSRQAVLAGLDASLARLGTDHIDLHQFHRWDPHTPIEEASRRWTRRCGRGRCATWGRRACGRGSSARRCTWPASAGAP